MKLFAGLFLGGLLLGGNAKKAIKLQRSCKHIISRGVYKGHKVIEGYCSKCGNEMVKSPGF